MTEAVLLLRRHFGAGALTFRHPEQWIVAEAVLATCLMQDAAVPQAFAEDRQRIVGMSNQRQGADELRAALGVRHVFQGIEQLGIVRRVALAIGIVDRIVGVRRARLVFTGQADHAGTTPMARRRDAFLAAADFALQARGLLATAGSRVSVSNIGVVTVHPGAANVVPGRAELVHEMRDPDPAALERLAAAVEALARAVGRARAIEVELRPLSATTPTACGRGLT